MNFFTFTLFVCLALLLATSLAAPSGPDDFTQLDEPEMGVRMPRATCDLLSPTIMGNSLNHAACAAHCLAMRRGFKGGRCRDGVCHCRK